MLLFAASRSCCIRCLVYTSTGPCLACRSRSSLALDRSHSIPSSQAALDLRRFDAATSCCTRCPVYASIGRDEVLGAVGWSREMGLVAFKMEGIGQAREAQSEGTILPLHEERVGLADRLPCQFLEPLDEGHPRVRVGEHLIDGRQGASILV